MTEGADVERAHGFANQRLVVVPRPLVREALSRPITRHLVVTDAGVFPAAEDHGRYRPVGAEETIIVLCVAGRGWVETAGARTEVGKGAAVVLPGGTGQAHAYGAAPGDPWTIWWCHVRGSDVFELVAEAGVGTDRPIIPLLAVDRLTAMLDEIITALEKDQSPARLVATAGMAWKLLATLAVDRRVPETGTPLQQALNYLEERADGTIRLPELAALVGVSPSHLSKLFREATGGGVLAHHTALKMARARHLLDTTDLSIAQVGREVGLQDQFYFSRQFRRLHGVSPSAYRADRKG
ncbi:AraC family transcriptional regulator of arabinose operon [Pseudarthrobacter defluvii]|uniref:AraC family transcriptional regulator n=1 Tax=Pseudarthrobacter defluvii TaxID=410837 RepID=UPI0027812834|nr:AraC family transcriptional regulator [Pseudarthrobacter defluvii]MDQ0771173.1 AraC family transcriptional regulator of arabinose operon [Pseudarthrobacter defluvii]